VKIVTAAALLLTLAACGQESEKNSADSSVVPTSGGVDLTGAGATFPYPLYSKWFSDYAARTGVKINYQSIGSGGGIRQLSEETVDFGATDGPMTDDEMRRAKGGPILHIPTVLGADAITYNLPGVPSGLKLTPDVLADIFLGKITKWNDPRLATLNAGVRLPTTDLLVVHRSDGSGTTYIFTDYLTAVSPAWKAGPGRGKEVRWPVGLGAKGNEGVAGQIKQTPGSIGYVELAYAKQNDLSVAAVRNAAGEFIVPSVAAVTAAAAGAAQNLPPNTDYRISIVNPPGAGAYPISSFTWLLVYQRQKDSVKARKLVDFLNWALTEGEAQAAPLDYAPIPESMAANLKGRIATIAVAPTR
jgi:phosphate transport system substrate-binding protein